MKKIIYLCVPYSHKSKKVREHRAMQADLVAARLMEMGHIVFSPISHSHRIEPFVRGRSRLNFWLEQDQPFLEIADEVAILKLDGWDKSKGIAHEMLVAERLNKPIFYIEPDDFECGGG